MADIARILPDLEGEEARFIGGILRDMSDEQAQSFAFAYRAKRRDPNIVLVLTLMSFGAFGRIYLGQVAMGIIYLLTLGFCGIGVLVDLVSNRSLTLNYNIDMARRLVFSISALGPTAERTSEPLSAPVTETQPEAEEPQVEVAAEQPSPIQEPSRPEPVLMSDDLIEELEKLAGLRERGILSDEEFQSQKDRLLGTGQ